ncbi:MAG: Fe-S cluster assembly protein SufD, partial [Dehalococcoidia bacterium]
GFPTARRGNEEWKYTDVGPIARESFQPLLTPPAPVRLKTGELGPFTFRESSWSRLVFVDGSYNAQLSSLSSLPAGVSVVNLAEAMTSKADLVEHHLARHASYATNAFTALNTAFVHEGALVYIPDGTLVEEPVHLLFLSTSRQQATVSHPRVLVLVGKESRATIIESYGGLADGRYFTNTVTEVVLGAGAVVRHYRVQRQSEQAFHIGTHQVELDRDSTFSSVTLDMGGGLVRNNLNVLMGGEGSSCMLNGLYLVTRSQHVDNQVIIDHAKPYTTSRELYKGILDGKSRSVFHGSIIVRKGAQKVDAQQVDKNLLLSDQAEADTKPAFWIYADDVKCGHGAACGQFDEHALFYLRSRGIGEKTARSLLTRAFVSEVIASIDREPFRTHVDRLVRTTVQEWLGDDGAAEERD